MFSINFYPEFDSHHTIFRALCIRNRFNRLPISLYRIVDYYFLNPFDVRSIRMPGNTHKKISEKYEYLKPYRRSSEPASAAIHMWPFQQGALTVLARRGFVSITSLSSETVSFSTAETPAPLLAEVETELALKADVLDFLDALIVRFPLSGPGGLKDRTGLLDHRYDVKSHAASA